VVDGNTGRVIWSFNTTKSEMSSDLVVRTAGELQMDFFVFRAKGQLLPPHTSTSQRVIVAAILLSGCQTNDKVGQFRLPIKSANKNLSSVMQKSAEFVCH